MTLRRHACFVRNHDRLRRHQNPALRNFEKVQGRRPVLTTAMKSVGEAWPSVALPGSLQKAPLFSRDPALWSRRRSRRNRRRVAPGPLPCPRPKRLPDRRSGPARRHEVSAEVNAVTSASILVRSPEFRSPEVEAKVRARGAADRNANALIERRPWAFPKPPWPSWSPRRKSWVRRIPRARRVVPSTSVRHLAPPEFAARRPTSIPPTNTLLGHRGAGLRGPAPRRARRPIIPAAALNRIGQGIEFDYCCCHAPTRWRTSAIESIMVNCNPETVPRTDYDKRRPSHFEAADATSMLARDPSHKEQSAAR